MPKLSLNEARFLINNGCISEKIPLTGDYLVDYVLLINKWLDEEPIYFEYKYPFPVDVKYLMGEKLQCTKATEGLHDDKVTSITLHFNSNLTLTQRLKGWLYLYDIYTWKQEKESGTTIDFEKFFENKKETIKYIKRRNAIHTRHIYTYKWLSGLSDFRFIRNVGLIDEGFYHTKKAFSSGFIYDDYKFYSSSNQPRSIYHRVWDVFFIEDQSAIDEFKMGIWSDYMFEAFLFVVVSQEEVKDFIETYEYEFSTDNFKKEYIYDYRRLAEVFVFLKKPNDGIIAGNTSVFVSAKKGVEIDLKSLCNEFLVWLKDEKSMRNDVEKMVSENVNNDREESINRNIKCREETIEYLEKYIVNKF